MSLRVATLNVWGLPRPLGIHVAERLERIGEEVARLELDLVALQEVWTRDARETLIRAGYRAGLIHTWHRPQALGGSGLLILSRWPFLETEFQPYLLGGPPHHTRLDYFGGKGFARVRVEGPRGPFTLFNTHLQARYGSRVDHEYVGHRAGQLIQLARAMRGIEDPILLLGDFNFREDHVGYGVLRGLSAVRDLGRDFGRSEATVLPENPYRNHDNPRRVDYVFSRDGRHLHWEPRWVRRAFDEPFTVGDEAATYSNHAGVMAEVELAVGEGWHRASLEREALDQAREALAAGRVRAEQRRAAHRGGAVTALALAGGIAASLRAGPVNRRRFLRHALEGTAIGLTLPAAGIAAMSEYAVPSELEAFDVLGHHLANLTPTVFEQPGPSGPAANAFGDDITPPEPRDDPTRDR